MDSTTLLIVAVAILATMDICIFSFACAIWWLLINNTSQHHAFKFAVTDLMKDFVATVRVIQQGNAEK